MNVPRSIAVVVSSRLATLYELDTIYGIKDCFDLLEIAQVDSHNEAVASAPRTAGAR